MCRLMLEYIANVAVHTALVPTDISYVHILTMIKTSVPAYIAYLT